MAQQQLFVSVKIPLRSQGVHMSVAKLRRHPNYARAIRLILREAKKRGARDFVKLPLPGEVTFAWEPRLAVPVRCLAMFSIWPWNFVGDEQRPCYIGRVDVAWND